MGASMRSGNIISLIIQTGADFNARATMNPMGGSFMMSNAAAMTAPINIRGQGNSTHNCQTRKLIQLWGQILMLILKMNTFTICSNRSTSWNWN